MKLKNENRKMAKNTVNVISMQNKKKFKNSEGKMKGKFIQFIIVSLFKFIVIPPFKMNESQKQHQNLTH